jgi:hypothetical protein
MFQVVDRYHQENGKDDCIVGVSNSKSDCVQKENILEFQKEESKDDSGDKFDNRILNGNTIFTAFASASQEEKAKNRNELIPRKLLLASHASAPTSERAVRVVSKNYYI